MDLRFSEKISAMNLPQATNSTIYTRQRMKVPCINNALPPGYSV